jgi:hypothetical protein
MGKLFKFYFEFPDMLEFRKSETTTSSRIESTLETIAMSTAAKINAMPLRYYLSPRTSSESKFKCASSKYFFSNTQNFHKFKELFL